MDFIYTEGIKMESNGSLLLLMFLSLLSIVVYFLPTIVAWKRDSKNMVSIFFLTYYQVGRSLGGLHQ